jgi:hypothetical protein
MAKSLFENTVVPEPLEQEKPVAEEPVKVEAEKSSAPSGEVKKEEPVKEEPKKSWLDEFNSTHQTSYKTPDEIKSVLEKARKADEYEPKLKEWEQSKKAWEDEKAQLSSLINPLGYFSSQEAFIAEQLRRQHPDKSPSVLQEIVTQDSKGMNELDVLIKNTLLENPGLIGGEQGAKEMVYDSLGITEDTPMKELPTLVQNKIMAQAKQVRRAWDELKGTVKLPEIKTPEQMEADKLAKVEERAKVLSTYRDEFSKSEEFVEEIEEGEVFRYKLSDEDRRALPEVFNTYMAASGLEPTKENLDHLKYLSESLTLRNNFKQIYKIIKGDVETRMKAEAEKELGNFNPTNTRTGLETGDQTDKQKYNAEHGFGKFLKS